jgi:short-subunit dehydrogenase involved in D-alanine esterification of teichoic acids
MYQKVNGETPAGAKVIVITGGTGGIGYQEALLLGNLPEKHTNVITGRDQARGAAAVSTLKSVTDNPNIHLLIADMSSQSEIQKLGVELLSRFPVIDELINNAGQLTLKEKVTTPDKQVESVDGIEEDFAVNVVGPVILSRLLVPALKAATPTGKIQVTSGGLAGLDDIHFDDIYGTKVQSMALHMYALTMPLLT